MTIDLKILTVSESRDSTPGVGSVLQDSFDLTLSEEALKNRLADLSPLLENATLYGRITDAFEKLNRCLFEIKYDFTPNSEAASARGSGVAKVHIRILQDSAILFLQHKDFGDLRGALRSALRGKTSQEGRELMRELDVLGQKAQMLDVKSPHFSQTKAEYAQMLCSLFQAIGLEQLVAFLVFENEKQKGFDQVDQGGATGGRLVAAQEKIANVIQKIKILAEQEHVVLSLPDSRSKMHVRRQSTGDVSKGSTLVRGAKLSKKDFDTTSLTSVTSGSSVSSSKIQTEFGSERDVVITRHEASSPESEEGFISLPAALPSASGSLNRADYIKASSELDALKGSGEEIKRTAEKLQQLLFNLSQGSDQQQKLAHVVARNLELEREIGEAQKSSTRDLARKTELEKELREAKIQVASLANMRDELQSKLSGANSENAQAQVFFRDLESAFTQIKQFFGLSCETSVLPARIREAVNKIKQEADRTTKEASVIDVQLQEALNQKTALERRLREVQDTNKATIDKLQQDSVALQVEIANLNTTIGTEKAKFERQEKQNAAAQKQLEALNASLSKEVDSLKRTIASVESRDADVANKEAIIRNLQDQLSNLKEQIAQNLQEIDQLDRQLNDSRTNLEATENKLREAEREIVVLQSHVKTASDLNAREVKELKDKITQKEKDIDALTTRAFTLEKELREARQEAEDLRAKLDFATQELAQQSEARLLEADQQQREEIELLSRQLQALKQQLEETANEKERFFAAFEDAKHEKLVAENRLKNVQTEVDWLRSSSEATKIMLNQTEDARRELESKVAALESRGTTSGREHQAILEQLQIVRQKTQDLNNELVKSKQELVDALQQNSDLAFKLQDAARKEVEMQLALEKARDANQSLQSRIELLASSSDVATERLGVNSKELESLRSSKEQFESLKVDFDKLELAFKKSEASVNKVKAALEVANSVEKGQVMFKIASVSLNAIGALTQLVEHFSETWKIVRGSISAEEKILEGALNALMVNVVKPVQIRDLSELAHKVAELSEMSQFGRTMFQSLSTVFEAAREQLLSTVEVIGSLPTQSPEALGELTKKLSHALEKGRSLLSSIASSEAKETSKDEGMFGVLKKKIEALASRNEISKQHRLAIFKILSEETPRNSLLLKAKTSLKSLDTLVKGSLQGVLSDSAKALDSLLDAFDFERNYSFMQFVEVVTFANSISSFVADVTVAAVDGLSRALVVQDKFNSELSHTVNRLSADQLKANAVDQDLVLALQEALIEQDKIIHEHVDLSSVSNLKAKIGKIQELMSRRDAINERLASRGVFLNRESQFQTLSPRAAALPSVIIMPSSTSTFVPEVSEEHIDRKETKINKVGKVINKVNVNPGSTLIRGQVSLQQTDEDETIAPLQTKAQEVAVCDSSKVNRQDDANAEWLEESERHISRPVGTLPHDQRQIVPRHMVRAEDALFERKSLLNSEFCIETAARLERNPCEDKVAQITGVPSSLSRLKENIFNNSAFAAIREAFSIGFKAAGLKAGSNKIKMSEEAEKNRIVLSNAVLLGLSDEALQGDVKNVHKGKLSQATSEVCKQSFEDFKRQMSSMNAFNVLKGHEAAIRAFNQFPRDLDLLAPLEKMFSDLMNARSKMVAEELIHQEDGKGITFEEAQNKRADFVCQTAKLIKNFVLVLDFYAKMFNLIVEHASGVEEKAFVASFIKAKFASRMSEFAEAALQIVSDLNSEILQNMRNENEHQEKRLPTDPLVRTLEKSIFVIEMLQQRINNVFMMQGNLLMGKLSKRSDVVPGELVRVGIMETHDFMKENNMAGSAQKFFVLPIRRVESALIGNKQKENGYDANALTCVPFSLRDSSFDTREELIAIFKLVFQAQELKKPAADRKEADATAVAKAQLENVMDVFANVARKRGINTFGGKAVAVPSCTLPVLGTNVSDQMEIIPGNFVKKLAENAKKTDSKDTVCSSAKENLIALFGKGCDELFRRMVATNKKLNTLIQQHDEVFSKNLSNKKAAVEVCDDLLQLREAVAEIFIRILFGEFRSMETGVVSACLVNLLSNGFMGRHGTTNQILNVLKALRIELQFKLAEQLTADFNALIDIKNATQAKLNSCGGSAEEKMKIEAEAREQIANVWSSIKDVACQKASGFVKSLVLFRGAIRNELVLGFRFHDRSNKAEMFSPTELIKSLTEEETIRMFEHVLRVMSNVENDNDINVVAKWLKNDSLYLVRRNTPEGTKHLLVLVQKLADDKEVSCVLAETFTSARNCSLEFSIRDVFNFLPQGNNLLGASAIADVVKVVRAQSKATIAPTQAGQSLDANIVRFANSILEGSIKGAVANLNTRLKAERALFDEVSAFEAKVTPALKAIVTGETKDFGVLYKLLNEQAVRDLLWMSSLEAKEVEADSSLLCSKVASFFVDDHSFGQKRFWFAKRIKGLSFLAIGDKEDERGGFAGALKQKVVEANVVTTIVDEYYKTCRDFTKKLKFIDCGNSSRIDQFELAIANLFISHFNANLLNADISASEFSHAKLLTLVNQVIALAQDSKAMKKIRDDVVKFAEFHFIESYVKRLFRVAVIEESLFNPASAATWNPWVKQQKSKDKEAAETEQGAFVQVAWARKENAFQLAQIRNALATVGEQALLERVMEEILNVHKFNADSALKIDEIISNVVQQIEVSQAHDRQALAINVILESMPSGARPETFIDSIAAQVWLDVLIGQSNDLSKIRSVPSSVERNETKFLGSALMEEQNKTVPEGEFKKGVTSGLKAVAALVEAKGNEKENAKVAEAIINAITHSVPLRVADAMFKSNNLGALFNGVEFDLNLINKVVNILLMRGALSTVLKETKTSQSFQKIVDAICATIVSFGGTVSKEGPKRFLRTKNVRSEELLRFRKKTTMANASEEAAIPIANLFEVIFADEQKVSKEEKFVTIEETMLELLQRPNRQVASEVMCALESIFRASKAHSDLISFMVKVVFKHRLEQVLERTVNRVGLKFAPNFEHDLRKNMMANGVGKVVSEIDAPIAEKFLELMQVFRNRFNTLKDNEKEEHEEFTVQILSQFMKLLHRRIFDLQQGRAEGLKASLIVASALNFMLRVSANTNSKQTVQQFIRSMIESAPKDAEKMKAALANQIQYCVDIYNIGGDLIDKLVVDALAEVLREEVAQQSDERLKALKAEIVKEINKESAQQSDQQQASSQEEQALAMGDPAGASCPVTGASSTSAKQEGSEGVLRGVASFFSWGRAYKGKNPSLASKKANEDPVVKPNAQAVSSAVAVKAQGNDSSVTNVKLVDGGVVKGQEAQQSSKADAMNQVRREIVAGNLDAQLNATASQVQQTQVGAQADAVQTVQEADARIAALQEELSLVQQTIDEGQNKPSSADAIAKNANRMLALRKNILLLEKQKRRLSNLRA